MKPFDSAGTFLPEMQKADVKILAVRGAGVSTFAAGLAFFIQMIGTIILARLLTPTDFGVVTMVTTFSLLLTSFGLNGFTEAVLQRKEIDHWLVSNLFWINIAVGALLTLGFAGAGSLLASFFHEPRVKDAAVGMSATILLTSTSILHLALLKRAMRFSSVSANEIVARSLSVAVSIFLGILGWGYWALVVGACAHPLAKTIGAWWQCRWIPSFPRRAPGTASTVRFAMNVYLHFIVNYAGWNTDNLLVGWRFQAEALAFYKKAFDLFVLPANQLLSPVGAVGMSALSKFHRDPIQFKRHFLRVLSIFGLIGMAVSADLTLVGRDVIRLMLGTRWDESGRIFTFFGPGIGAMLLYGTHGWVHVSLGKAERWFRWGVVELTVTVLLFLLCLRWGPVGIAIAWSASYWILTVPAFWYAGTPIQLGIWPILSAVWKYIAASLSAGVISAVITASVPSLVALSGLAGTALRIVIVSLLFGTLYLIFVIILHRGLTPINLLARLLRDMLPQRWFSAQSTGIEPAGSTDPAGEPDIQARTVNGY